MSSLNLRFYFLTTAGQPATTASSPELGLVYPMHQPLGELPLPTLYIESTSYSWVRGAQKFVSYIIHLSSAPRYSGSWGHASICRRASGRDDHGRDVEVSISGPDRYWHLSLPMPDSGVRKRVGQGCRWSLDLANKSGSRRYHAAV